MITEEVVKAAAGNEEGGERVMALLLEKRGGEVMISKEVVRAAAGNEWSGEKVLALLVEERGDEVMITEEVLKAAAGNEGSGEKVLALLEKSQDGMGMQAKDELIWIRKLQNMFRDALITTVLMNKSHQRTLKSGCQRRDRQLTTTGMLLKQ
ncbi:hypothetical protein AFUB_102360 [Aspergillus fumigatus A1163]|uniref:Uncharacterized protein n=1 Tax=Aspergillus fumigatus (strain CBS 144.89 / FGSC A1163 / CEA10) TaxID=451804 RepID=B0YFB1_ASPFC|nr:hypothetical protein AFUB_102360 [Aspergillus fumigatus A1163]